MGEFNHPLTRPPNAQCVRRPGSGGNFRRLLPERAHSRGPLSLIGFAGARVIEQTIREKLPEGFQRSEYLLDHGMLDRVTHRKALKDELTVILRMLTRQGPAIRGDLPRPEAATSEAR